MLTGEKALADQHPVEFGARRPDVVGGDQAFVGFAGTRRGLATALA